MTDPGTAVAPLVPEYARGGEIALGWRSADGRFDGRATLYRLEVEDQIDGFFDFGSKEPITGVLEGEFRGFGKGRIYTLDNGQTWEQTDATTLAGVRKTSPKVSMNPGLLGVWYMKVEGVNTQAKVRRTK
mgnify:CR=1 FL=1